MDTTAWSLRSRAHWQIHRNCWCWKWNLKYVSFHGGVRGVSYAYAISNRWCFKGLGHCKWYFPLFQSKFSFYSQNPQKSSGKYVHWLDGNRVHTGRCFWTVHSTRNALYLWRGKFISYPRTLDSQTGIRLLDLHVSSFIHVFFKFLSAQENKPLLKVQQILHRRSKVMDGTLVPRYCKILGSPAENESKYRAIRYKLY